MDVAWAVVTTEVKPGFFNVVQENEIRKYKIDAREPEADRHLKAFTAYIMETPDDPGPVTAAKIAHNIFVFVPAGLKNAKVKVTSANVKTGEMKVRDIEKFVDEEILPKKEYDA